MQARHQDKRARLEAVQSEVIAEANAYSRQLRVLGESLDYITESDLYVNVKQVLVAVLRDQMADAKYVIDKYEGILGSMDIIMSKLDDLMEETPN